MRRMVKFNADGSSDVVMSLARLGIRHDVDSGKAHQPSLVTVYYDPGEEAEKLFSYLVQNAPFGDKVVWQQDQAHREIEGWCELCEVVNTGECDGGCLMDPELMKHPDFLFSRWSR